MPKPGPGDRDQQGADQTKEVYRAMESDLLKSLTAFADATKGEVTPIVLKRSGGTEVRFRVRPMTEEEYQECKEKSTRYGRNKAFGNIRIPEEMNQGKYRSWIIYTATIDEDRAAIWDNKALWARLDVPTGAYLVDKLLRGGEKDKVVAKIDEISGYGQVEQTTDDDLEETMGN